MSFTTECTSASSLWGLEGTISIFASSLWGLGVSISSLRASPPPLPAWPCGAQSAAPENHQLAMQNALAFAGRAPQLGDDFREGGGAVLGIRRRAAAHEGDVVGQAGKAAAGEVGHGRHLQLRPLHEDEAHDPERRLVSPGDVPAEQLWLAQEKAGRSSRLPPCMSSSSSAPPIIAA